MKNKGFTLVELLVVIAIIVLLMSILMAALRGQRGQTGSTTCRPDLEKWGLATVFYNEGCGDRLLIGTQPLVEAKLLENSLALPVLLSSGQLQTNGDSEQPNKLQYLFGLLPGIGLVAGGSSRKRRKRNTLVPYIKTYIARILVYLERCRPYTRTPAEELRVILGTNSPRIGWLVEEYFLERDIREQCKSLLRAAKKGGPTKLKRYMIDRNLRKLRYVRAML